MNNVIPFDGFAIKLKFDDDRDWYACFLEIPTVSAFADTISGAIAELEIVWNEYKLTCIEIGKPVPVPVPTKE